MAPAENQFDTPVIGGVEGTSEEGLPALEILAELPLDRILFRSSAGLIELSSNDYIVFGSGEYMSQTSRGTKDIK